MVRSAVSSGVARQSHADKSTLGTFKGIYGACFAKLNMLWSRHVRGGTWLRTHPIKEVALVRAYLDAAISSSDHRTCLLAGNLDDCRVVVH